jgi:hypothetical protein
MHWMRRASKVQQRIVAQGRGRTGSLRHCLTPQLALDPPQALEPPIGGNQRIHQHKCLRRVWLELLAIVCGQSFHFGGILSGNHLRLGVEAGFERVKT